jgi:hypothetical protein
VHSLFFCSCAQEVYVDYYAKYELGRYVPWFLNWALNLLYVSEGWFEPIAWSATALLQRKKHRAAALSCREECEEEKENQPALQCMRGRASVDGQSLYEVATTAGEKTARQPLQELPVHKITPLTAPLPLQASIFEEALLECDLAAIEEFREAYISTVASSLTAPDSPLLPDNDAPWAAEEGDAVAADTGCTCEDEATPFRVSAHQLRIVTDPAQLQRMVVRHRQEAAERVIQHAVDTCKLTDEEAEESDTASGVTLHTAASNLSACAEGAILATQEEVNEAAGVFGHFLSTIWDIFSPRSQHPPESGPVAEVALVTPATLPRTEKVAESLVESENSQVDSLAYSASTRYVPAWKSMREERRRWAGKTALGWKRRIDDEESMPWGF